MVAHVLGLRLSLLFGGLRGDTTRATRILLGLILLAAATAATCWAMLTLRDTTLAAVLAVTVLGGSAVTLGFALAPLIAAVSDPLDPRRFAVLDLAPLPLAAVLALAGVISIPVFALIAVSAATVLVWIDLGVPWLPAVASAVMGVLTCVLVARVSMALTSLFLRERRSRELSGLFLLAVLVIVVPAVVFLSSLEWGGRVPTQLAEAVSTLALTPLGAAWAFPGLLAAAEGEAWPSLLIAVATLLALGALWALLVRRLMTTTEKPAVGRERGGLGWFGVAPDTPGGVVAARSLHYWFGDRRYLVNLVIVPVAAAVTIVPLLIAGIPLPVAALVPVPFAALLLGWLPHNDLAYDSTAVWMHIASGMRGVSDRVGRLVPVLLVGLPLLAVAVPLAVALHGRWALLPAMIGVSASLFFAALGLSSVASVLTPYAVSRPGESPFQQPQRTGASGAIGQGVVMFGAIAVSAPVLWWAWLALTRDVAYAEMAMWAGFGIGLGVLLVGIVIGAVVFERRGSRLMEFAETT